MKSTIISFAILCIAAVSSFVPQLPARRTALVVGSKTKVFMGFMDEPERKKLTRDTEPDEFFKTNTDKMTDAEKLPLAIGGFLFISLPFIAGLIALYASK
eukprot:CAMPEP_0116554976 /NCGR_PEP_ID=MMETSP0397-20121206/7888_1 /TAXON_ID=216820 /ORGANISM="Cyclophora tenuis, Strain ECT3854" /LENGTH=99 /DNA_ID=CAMNT_0004080191 /DNA_START=85 /DNA_END=384 /DNA_ORIENTATION=-